MSYPIGLACYLPVGPVGFQVDCRLGSAPSCLATEIAERLSNELSDDLSNEEIESHAVQLCRCFIEKLEQMATRAWTDCENEEIV